MTSSNFKFIITVRYRESRRDDLFSVDYEIDAQSVKEALEIADNRFGMYKNSTSATWVRKIVGKPVVKIEIDGNTIVPAHSARISTMLGDFDASQRIVLAEWLIYTEPSRADDAVSALLAVEEDERVRASIAGLLGSESTKPMRKSLQVALADPDGRVRANAIEAVQNSGRKDLLSMVVPLASDPNNRARANAVKAISALGETELLDTLRLMMSSRDRWMRASAVYALGEMRDPSAFNLLIESLKEDDAVVQFNSARAISRIFKSEQSEKVFLTLKSLDSMTSFTLKNILLRNCDVILPILKKYLKDEEYKGIAEDLLDMMAFKAFKNRKWLKFLRFTFRKI